MTGIGNYSFHLLRSLITNYPELQFLGFGLRSWSPLTAATLQQIEDSQGTPQTGASDPLRQAIRLLRTGSYRRLARFQLAQSIYRLNFSRTVRLQPINLLHAFNYLPVADPGVPTLPVVYDLSFVRFPQFHPADRLKALERLPKLVDQSPLIQTISQFSRNEIAAYYGIDQSRIFVATPAAAHIFRPLGPEATRRDLDRLDLLPGRYLLTVGTLEPRKNLRTLVQAYAQIPKATRQRVSLIVVGGAGWGELELPFGTAGLLSEGTLRFLGMVNNRELRSLYEGAVGLLYPSVYEGFGMPVVEAMACGTEVVHSADSSMDEISNGFATRVSANDVDAWRTAIADLVAAPAKTRERAERLIAQAATFSWRSSAGAVRKAYADLLDH